MRLKRQVTHLLVLGGLAAITTGIASAGGYPPGCGWCGSPAPKAMSQTVAVQPSLFSAIWTTLLTLI